MSLTREIYQIADELRASANVALHFETNEYVVERFKRVLAASARLVAAVEGRDPDEILARYEDNMFHASPLIGAEAAVFQDARVLLIQRQNNGLWALPGGLTDVGETLAGTAERELREETNVRGRAVRLMGILDSRLWGSPTKVHLYHAVFQVKAEDASPSAGSEALDVGFFPEDSLPPLSPGHHLRVPLVFKQLRGEAPIPYFDTSD